MAASLRNKLMPRYDGVFYHFNLEPSELIPDALVQQPMVNDTDR